MTHPSSLEIAAFVATVNGAEKPAFGKHMKEALLWLSKRERFSHEYYRQLKRSSTQKKLHDSLWMDDDDVIRIRFEAAILAYIQNIHAACDAFPFALHVLLGGLSKKPDNDDEHFKWTVDLIKRVETKFPHATDLHADLRAFAADHNFLILAALVNQAKHKYFPKIWNYLHTNTNKYDLLLKDIEYFSYPNGVKTQHSKQEIDVVEFLKTIHNETLVKVYKLYERAYDAVVSS